MGQFEALLKLLPPRRTEQRLRHYSEKISVTPHVVFKIVVFIICVLFVKECLVLRETDNELVS